MYNTGGLNIINPGLPQAYDLIRQLHKLILALVYSFDTICLLKCRNLLLLRPLVTSSLTPFCFSSTPSCSYASPRPISTSSFSSFSVLLDGSASITLIRDPSTWSTVLSSIEVEDKNVELPFPTPACCKQCLHNAHQTQTQTGLFSLNSPLVHSE